MPSVERGRDGGRDRRTAWRPVALRGVRKSSSASAANGQGRGPGSAETAPAWRRGGKRGKQPQAAPAAVKQHKTLFELTNKTCRWIVEATVKLAVAWAWSHLH